MAIRNIIQKAEQEFPPGIKQELDPLARPELALLSGYINSTASNIIFTTGNQTISGLKDFVTRPTLNGTGVLLSGDIAYVQTNSYFYVDPTRTDSYVENGNILYPYKTLSGAYNAAKNIASFNNPTYITLLSPIAENLTINKGYINLVGNNTNKNDPIRITGSLVFAATGGTVTDNNFSIAGLGITATSNNKCILFSGNNPQRLFIQDCWLIANDNGTCLYSNNTNATSRLQGDILKLSPEGVNTTAIDIVSGISSISFAETSSSANVLAYVRNNSILNISNSQIETAGEKAFQVENTARLTLLNSVLTNTANPSTGIFLTNAASTAVVVGSAISVPANANSYAANGVANSYLFYKNLYFSIDAFGQSTESKIGNNINKILINSYDPVVYSIGDQTISGLKDFVTRPTVNGTGVLLSGEVSTDISGVFYTAEVKIKNNNGSTIYKGQPVYVSSASGNHILVKLASNTGESTSSKTFGLVHQSSLNQHTQGTVVTQGLLQGFNTSAAGNEGDPIWLGPTGNLIFGLTNKPQAPNHLVYLGVVTRKHATQGEIFVHIQNGFEVRELHDARIINEQNSDILIYNSGSGLWLNRQLNASDISDSTAAGRTLLTAATVQAQRTALDIFVASPNFATLTGTIGNFQRVYATQDNGKIYSWNGAGYSEISPTPTGELDNRYVQNYGNASGMQVMTTGAYNAITPLSGVVYILI